MTKTSFEQYIEDRLNKNPSLEEKLHKAEVALDIAYQIYDLRQKKGLTQDELAKLIGVSQSNIARLENAEYTGYSLKTLQKIAKALGSNLNILLTTPEQTSCVLNSLYNTRPNISQIRKGDNTFFYCYRGGLSNCATEAVDTSILFDSSNYILSLKSGDSDNKHKFLNI